MASIVVYKIVQGVEDRFQGMMEAGMRVANALNTAGAMETTILIGTLDGLIAERDAQNKPVYSVKYTHTNGQEYPLVNDGNLGSGKYEYTVPVNNTIKLKITPQRDKPNKGNENMHLTAPRDAVSLTQGSYLDNVLKDVGIQNPSDNQRKYMFGTIIFRRCR